MELIERRRETQKKYYEGRGRETSRRWYEKHKDEVIARAKSYVQTHREQRRISSLRYYYKHREQVRAYGRRFSQQRKVEVLTHYGNGKCACVECSFDNIKALTIDHIDGGGNEQRKKVGQKNLYNWLKSQDFPKGYQTLCMNCQFIKKVDEGEHRWKDQQN